MSHKNSDAAFNPFDFHLLSDCDLGTPFCFLGRDYDVDYDSNYDWDDDYAHEEEEEEEEEDGEEEEWDDEDYELDNCYE